MTQNRVITAHFTGQSVALASAAGSLTAQGFRLTLTGDLGTVYQIFGSSNLTSWQSLGLVTNNSGVAQFTDPNATNAHLMYYRAVLSP